MTMEVYLIRNEQRSGPHTEGDVQALVAAKEIERICLAWREGLPGWLPLEEVVTLPTRPPPAAFPAGLPPVPTRATKETRIKSVLYDLEKRLATTNFGQVIDRLDGKFMSMIGLILIVVIKFACHHAP